MPAQDSVLAHLALTFGSHPENLATEALTFVLNGSKSAQGALLALVRDLGTPAQQVLTFSSQATDSAGGRPDIVGHDINGHPSLVIEAKFWAGLTDAQPVQYLSSFAAPGGLLLFIAPSRRLDILWQELLRRCSEAGLATGQTETVFEARSINAGGHRLALISWRSLLQVLSRAATLASEPTIVADIDQISALCERMDSEAFLPLSREELSSTGGARRLVQFGELANELTDRLVAAGHADVRNLRAAGGNGWYGRYLRLKGYGCRLFFSAWQWLEFGDSPLWLSIKAPDWTQVPAVRNLLQRAGISAFRNEGEECLVPVRLLPNVEQPRVVEAALAQIRSVRELLPELEAAGLTTAPAAPEA